MSGVPSVIPGLVAICKLVVTSSFSTEIERKHLETVIHQDNTVTVSFCFTQYSSTVVWKLKMKIKGGSSPQTGLKAKG